MAAEMVTGDGGASRKLLRPFVASAVGVAPGPELVTALIGLMARADLSAREWTEVIGGWARLGSFCDAGRLTAVAELDRALTPAATVPEAVSGSVSGVEERGASVRAAADELAPVLRISPKAASTLVALSRRLDNLPAAADALAEGRMDYTQLRVTEEVTRDLPTPTATQIEAAAVRWAPRQTRSQLRTALASEAARLDPSHATTAVRRGVAERDVSLRPSPLAGCRRLVADLPITEAVAAWNALNGVAKNIKRHGVRPDGTPEDRTVAQLRADLLTAVLTGQADPHGATVPTPDQLTRLAEVHVVVAYDALIGITDLPAHLPGVGPLDARTARHLASHAPLRRLVADTTLGTLLHRDDHTHSPIDASAPARRRPNEQAPPQEHAAPHEHPPPHEMRHGEQQDGDRSACRLHSDPRLQRMLTDALPSPPPNTDPGGGNARRATVGPDTYRPTARLRAFVHTRDATCLGPACSHPATGTQLDHTINHGERDAFGVLGTTTQGNLGSVCERIHNAKTHRGWRLRQVMPGHFEWTTATGRTYTVRARPLVPGWPTLPGRSAQERPPPPPMVG